ncbi:ABC transporter ATP-binding protein [Bradyrhizobium sp. U87765 SZCCT0131]|uniref:ABC transporter ATP-binding protein n=1 Tax=unclassified Bradyrhizobium TaxID=2631580 RepID=UPI001BA55B6C|nr:MULTISPECIES: ABC transporter ATP-binding protein [unclassified Bradyrhizobium]MBR1217735.1 ABC transporter ATP-binding protein [Bradyrhizobium sp. U87765 SZCCT0131]MBR1261319.1 ABC transporter ATP-binding protein [Bradyrhizobium sp. U87765 SZCCT0134]MBR1303233.1 ABC transporter ATP-binding protein [Bradyrhizobium sp. U87765 SZCCT0110]MBR1318839.1 ABC transporter ATP-binding protein [Bradyrhizobium sp. U87765 SZCCT0109]MBR1347164.1 ABC transporter ATP-binding protein [Bradyrhizobium sp. U87
MLEADNVSVVYEGGFKALNGVSVRLAAGAVTALIGPNGAGKSTLFGVLAGAVRPVAGDVRLGGQTVTRHGPAWRARRGLARTFQLSSELSSLTVLENLLVARPHARGERLASLVFARGAMRDEEAAGIDKARALLQRVDLWRLADAPAGTLSGGQKKLLELCRALMLDPRIVLMDEPSAGVNPTRISEVVAFVQALRQEGVTFGLVEHNMAMVRALSDHVYVLTEGQVLTEGRFDNVIADTQVASAYLGTLP